MEFKFAGPLANALVDYLAKQGVVRASSFVAVCVFFLFSPFLLMKFCYQLKNI